MVLVSNLHILLAGILIIDSDLRVGKLACVRPPLPFKLKYRKRIVCVSCFAVVNRVPLRVVFPECVENGPIGSHTNNIHKRVVTALIVYAQAAQALSLIICNGRCRFDSSDRKICFIN